MNKVNEQMTTDVMSDMAYRLRKWSRVNKIKTSIAGELQEGARSFIASIMQYNEEIVKVDNKTQE